MGDQLAITPIRRSRISQQIVVQLCTMLREGQLVPGDRLPAERELAERLGVSRASLREALRVLELAGVLEVRQGDGTIVRPAADAGILSPLMLLLDSRGDVIGDLLEVRLIFEPPVAARAALRHTPELLAEIERVVDEQAAFLAGTQLASGEDWLRSDRQFHAAVARASRNEVSVRVTSFLTELLQEARRHFGASEERRRHAWQRHAAILDAIRRRDANAARDAMLEHLREVETYILEGLVAKGRDPTGSGN